MKEYRKDEKAFVILHEAWYAETAVKPFEPHHIMIGFYNPEGWTEGEFSIIWDEAGIMLRIFDDAWEAFSKMPELISLLAELDKKKQALEIHEFAGLLMKLGYKDITGRIQPED